MDQDQARMIANAIPFTIGFGVFMLIIWALDTWKYSHQLLQATEDPTSAEAVGLDLSGMIWIALILHFVWDFGRKIFLFAAGFIAVYWMLQTSTSYFDIKSILGVSGAIILTLEYILVIQGKDLQIKRFNLRYVDTALLSAISIFSGVILQLSR